MLPKNWKKSFSSGIKFILPFKKKRSKKCNFEIICHESNIWLSKTNISKLILMKLMKILDLQMLGLMTLVITYKFPSYDVSEKLQLPNQIKKNLNLMELFLMM